MTDPFSVEVLTFRDERNRLRRVEGALRTRGELRGTFQCSGGLWFLSLKPALLAAGCEVEEFPEPYVPPDAPQASSVLLLRLSRAREKARQNR